MKAYLGEHFGLSQLQFFWIVDELNIYIAILNINIWLKKLFMLQ
jgi:hypothetical protein